MRRRCSSRPTATGSATAATMRKRITARSRRSIRATSAGSAWRASVEVGSDGKLETTPLVFNGVLYGTSTWSQVYAIDLRTSKMKWQWDPALVRGGFEGMGPRAVLRSGESRRRRCMTARSTSACSTAASWRSTPRPASRCGRCRPRRRTRDYTITGAPRIIKGNVVIGQGGAEYGVRGFLGAYNAQTGKLAWKFYVVPGDPTKPFEDQALAAAAKTWNGAVVEVRRRRHAVGRHRLRSRAESRLRRHRQRLAVEREPSQPRRRRQPVPRVDRRAQCRHRQVRLALPDDARRQLGLQRGAADDPRRSDRSPTRRAR